MKIRSKYLAIIVTLILVFTIVALYIGSKNANELVDSKIGNDVGEDEIVAIVNGASITRDDLDSYKTNSELYNYEYNESVVLNQIIDDKLLYDKAIRDGFTVTDEEVEEHIQQSKSALKESPDMANQLQEYMNALEITKDEYWELVRPVVERAMARGKLKAKLREDFLDQHPEITGVDAVREKFDEYLEQYIEDLKKKAKIKIYLE